MQLPIFLSKKQNQHVLSNAGLITKSSDPALSESLKSARTNLIYALANTDNEKCVLVTSALAAEGKTTTCINLAVSMAQTESRVLLIDADLRRPRTHTYLELQNKAGLGNYLGGFCDLESIINRIEELNIDYISAGDLPPNPSELLSSKKFKAFLDTIKEHYDYIFFDAPPVNAVADTNELAHKIKNVVFICKCGISITSEIEKALATLKFSEAKVLGFIVIEAESKKKKKEYSNYYIYE